MRLKLLSILLTAIYLLSPVVEASPKSRIVEGSVLEHLPAMSPVVDGYENVSAVTERLSQLPLHVIEGLWRFPSEGTLMAIERTVLKSGIDDNAGATVYRMVIVEAADMALRPGTVMGWLTPTAKRGVYDARIYSSLSPDGINLHSPKTYTLTLGDSDSRLSIASYGSSLRINWWRLLPYMYRSFISRREKSPGDIHGCVRIFPHPEVPSEPRYL